MITTRHLHVIDSHTAGEPTRILIGGVIQIPGNTMAEKKAYLMEKMDGLRTILMNEPRGHKDMFGSIITQACDPSADFGIIFCDGGGYLNMCGHGTIGAVTALIETGMVEAKEEIILDTPAGIVKAYPTIEGDKVVDVSFVNVPAFVLLKDQEIDYPGYGTIKFDISFGGSFFAILHADQIGMKIDVNNVAKLVEFGNGFKNFLNENLSISHPTLGHINTVDLVEVYDSATHPDATLKNVVIFGNGQVDRSPCGTGTSAKLATLYAKNLLKQNETFVYESILGTMFKGEIVSLTNVAQYEAIIPRITGSAWITGFNHLVVDPTDPLRNGFSI